jgi:hypothetical protein
MWGQPPPAVRRTESGLMCRVDAPARLPMSFDFVCLHIHAASPEPHTLCFKSQPLFDG